MYLQGDVAHMCKDVFMDVSFHGLSLQAMDELWMYLSLFLLDAELSYLKLCLKPDILHTQYIRIP